MPWARARATKRSQSSTAAAATRIPASSGDGAAQRHSRRTAESLSVIAAVVSAAAGDVLLGPDVRGPAVDPTVAVGVEQAVLGIGHARLDGGRARVLMEI